MLWRCAPSSLSPISCLHSAENASAPARDWHSRPCRRARRSRRTRRASRRCAPRRPPARRPASCSRRRSTPRPRSRGRLSRSCAHLRTSSTICSGVMRTLDYAVLAARRDGEGDLVRAGLDARARSPSGSGRAPRPSGLGCVSANATISPVSAIAGISFGGTNEPTSISFEAGRGEGADPGLLRLGGHQVLGVLQPVARADFADVDLSHGVLREGEF